MTRIKFCGLTRPADAAVAGSLGANYCGVILAESPRRVTPVVAAGIFAEAPGVRRVGVFRHASVGDIVEDARALRLDVIQLHGHVRMDDLEQLRDAFDVISGLHALDAGHRALSRVANGDSSMRALRSRMGIKRGNGNSWTGVAGCSRAIRSENGDILAAAECDEFAERSYSAPAAVDVSSGVESAPGIKDTQLMRLCGRVRSAYIFELIQRRTMRQMTRSTYDRLAPTEAHVPETLFPRSRDREAFDLPLISCVSQESMHAAATSAGRLHQ